MKVCEIFHSLQGEGSTIGVPTVFIRVTGCNLDCDWCDTKYAKTEGQEMGIGLIIEELKKYHCRDVCITGGEPLCQADTIKLIDTLLLSGYRVVLETNGSKSLEQLECDPNLIISMDIKCPSSGQADKMDFSNIELMGPTDQLKFVIADKKDYEHAKSVIEKYKPGCILIVTPVGGTNLKELAGWVLADKIEARVLPQLHKIIWGNERAR